MIVVEELSSQTPSQHNLAVTPNPFSKTTAISYNVAGNSQSVKLAIFDITGRLIVDLSARLAINGARSTIFWSGIDNCNRQVPAGVYFVHLDTGSESLVEKIILKR